MQFVLDYELGREHILEIEVEQGRDLFAPRHTREFVRRCDDQSRMMFVDVLVDDVHRQPAPEGAVVISAGDDEPALVWCEPVVPVVEGLAAPGACLYLDRILLLDDTVGTQTVETLASIGTLVGGGVLADPKPDRDLASSEIILLSAN